MERVRIDEVGPADVEEGVDCRRLTDPLGTTDVAINHYHIAPGSGFPGGLHAHMDQEEVFVVLEGAATFETMDGEVTAVAGEAIRFAPGEFQSGRTGGDADLVALALGEPKDTEDVRVPLSCPDCGHGDLRIEVGEGAVTLVCPECGAGQAPRDCPACGGELEATRRGGETVSVCRACGETVPDPFEG